MRIATCNVNGIRAAAKKGMKEWIDSANADVLLFQEVRCPEELVAPLIGEGYSAVIPWECEIKGRAGVCVALRDGIEYSEVVRGVSDPQLPVDTGRWLEVLLPEAGIRVISAYLHSGDAASEEKMAAKYAHLDLVDARLRELIHSGENFVVAGDFNIVHTEKDITNWKPNHNKRSGVLDPEIAYVDRWLTEYGLRDVQRTLDPESQGPYTWWSQRGKAFDNNTGWRIDYQMATPDLAARARSYRIDRASSYETRFSDHAPLVVDYEFDNSDQ